MLGLGGEGAGRLCGPLGQRMFRTGCFFLASDSRRRNSTVFPGGCAVSPTTWGHGVLFFFKATIFWTSSSINSGRISLKHVSCFQRRREKFVIRDKCTCGSKFQEFGETQVLLVRRSSWVLLALRLSGDVEEQ